jgi:hypothetical protein
MPEIWRDCLAGRGSGEGAGVDLSSVTPLAAQQHLWTTPGIASRIAGAVASKAIRTPVEKLEREAWPAALQGAPARGISVYAVAEPVLPGADVAAAVARPHERAIVAIAGVEAIQRCGERAAVRAKGADGTEFEFEAGVVVCAAGAGNEALAAMTGMGDAARMQRRPLHMVMARAPRGAIPPLFGHCLGASTVPRLTITTAEHAGSLVWYIGGGVAEEGVVREPFDQIAAAKDELALCLPWVDLSAARFATGRIDRAEGLTEGGRRPDAPVLHRRGPIVIGWPTKLAFAPAFAARVLEMMPGRPARTLVELPAFPVPGPAPRPWEMVSVWSSMP